MGKLTFEVKEFIEDNIDLIENDCWDEVYDNAQFNLDSSSTGLFTKIMLEQGIDPIERQGLDYIPNYYLSDVDLVEYNIPKGVHEVGEGAFSYTRMPKLTIPEEVNSIGSYAFYESNIKEIIILSKDTIIGDQAFHNCADDLEVYCIKGSPVADRLSEFEDISVRYI